MSTNSLVAGFDFSTFDGIRDAARHSATVVKSMRENPDVEIPADDLAKFRAVRPTLQKQLADKITFLQAVEPNFVPLTHKLTVNRNSGPLLQHATWQCLLEAWDKSILDGRSPADRGLVLIAIQEGSLLDMIGIDFLIVDSRTGNFVFLDSTTREKSADGICQFRMDHLLHDQMFFKTMHRHGLSDAMYSLRITVVNKLQRITKELEKSPLNLLDMRLPIVKEAIGPRQLLDTVHALSGKGAAQEKKKLLQLVQHMRDMMHAFVSDLENKAQYLQSEGLSHEAQLLFDYVADLSSGFDDNTNGGALWYIEHVCDVIANFACR